MSGRRSLRGIFAAAVSEPCAGILRGRLDAEVGHGRAEEHRCQFAALDLFHIEFVAGFVEEFDVVDEALVDVFVEEFFKDRIVGRALGRRQFALAVGRVLFKEFDGRRGPVVNAW